MQLDAVELEAEMSSISNDGFDMDTNHADNRIQPDIVSTGIDDDSDQEYETWDGFGLGTYLRRRCRFSLNSLIQRHR